MSAGDGDTAGGNPVTEAFVTHRNLLFTVAYELLGSAADAEDVVQETWLRWAEVRLESVRDARAYLVRIATRQALNRLRTIDRRREAYVGPWLPEPLLTSPDVAEQVELVDSLSTAMLLVLETLTPLERAVFVLHGVFDFDYSEIADAVEKSTVAVRKISHRARTQVRSRRSRQLASSAEVETALRSFQQAAETGDVKELISILAPDVVIVTDGGGLAGALPRPVVGAEKVGNLFGVAMDKVGAAMAFDSVQVNGSPALVMRLDGVVHGVLTLRVEEGRVAGVYFVRNPEKLTRLGQEFMLTQA